MFLSYRLQLSIFLTHFHSSHLQHAVLSNTNLKKLLHAIFPVESVRWKKVSNQLVNIVEHLAAKELVETKTGLKVHQVDTNTTPDEF